VVDANNQLVGPWFLLNTPTVPRPGFIDASGNVWRLDLETGALTGAEPTASTGTGYTYFVQPNCGGPGYVQVDVFSPVVGANLVVPMNGVFGTAPNFRARKGPLATTPASFASSRFNGACSADSYTSTPTARFVLSSDVASVTLPANAWVLPLRLAL